jgi:hypothetical protein
LPTDEKLNAAIELPCFDQRLFYRANSWSAVFSPNFYFVLDFAPAELPVIPLIQIFISSTSRAKERLHMADL